MIPTWLIVIVIVAVVTILGCVVAVRHVERKTRLRKQRRQEEVRRQLKPGRRFKAHGVGVMIKGEVIEVIDEDRVKAYCRAYDDQPGEIGEVEIERIFSVG